MSPRNDIFTEFQRIHERMEQAYQRVIGGPGSPRFCIPFLEPPVDIYETPEEIVVLVEMAGISPQDVNLEVDGTVLTVSGERKPLGGRPGRVYSQMEISHGRFHRDLLLPAEVNAEAAEAVYKDGILEIVLPKAAPVSSRHLRITVR